MADEEFLNNLARVYSQKTEVVVPGVWPPKKPYRLREMKVYQLNTLDQLKLMHGVPLDRRPRWGGIKRDGG